MAGFVKMALLRFCSRLEAVFITPSMSKKRTLGRGDFIGEEVDGSASRNGMHGSDGVDGKWRMFCECRMAGSGLLWAIEGFTSNLSGDRRWR